MRYFPLLALTIVSAVNAAAIRTTAVTPPVKGSDPVQLHYLIEAAIWIQESTKLICIRCFQVSNGLAFVLLHLYVLIFAG